MSNIFHIMVKDMQSHSQHVQTFHLYSTFFLSKMVFEILKQNPYFLEFFPDMTVFFNEKNSRYEVMGGKDNLFLTNKILINQSST